MKLAKEVTFNEYMKPICLPQKGINFEVGKVCTVTGFGRIRKKGRFADTLLKTVLRIVDNSTCLRIEGNSITALSRSDAAFCAGCGQRNTSFCKGDNGGPLACQKNGKFYLAGVVKKKKMDGYNFIVKIDLIGRVQVLVSGHLENLNKWS